jgi:hypothetical protein
LATAADASVRDGGKAVELARKAGPLGGGSNAAVLGTLAAAYAESGNCALAGETARRALGLAREQKHEALAERLQKEILLYDAGKPARQTIP